MKSPISLIFHFISGALITDYSSPAARKKKHLCFADGMHTRVLLGLLFLILLCTQSTPSLYSMIESEETHMEVVATLSFEDFNDLDLFHYDARSVAVNWVTKRAYFGGYDGFYIVDCDTNEILDYVYLGVRFESIYFIAVNSETNQIFVTGPKELDGYVTYVLDGVTYSVVGEIATAASRGGFAYNPTTNLMYISDTTIYYNEPDYVRVYDASNFSLITSIEIPGSREHLYVEDLWVAVNPKTNLLYVIWTGDGEISLIDCENYKVLKKVTCPEDYGPMVVNEATGYVYTGHSVLEGTTLEELTQLSGYVKVVNPVDNLVICQAYGDYACIYDGASHEMLRAMFLDTGGGGIVDVAVNTVTNKMYMVQAFGNVSAIEERSGPRNHVVINEFELNPSDNDNGMKEWVELYNPTSSDVNISSWILNVVRSGKEYHIPSGTVIEAGGYYVFVPYIQPDYWVSKETVWIELRRSVNGVVDVTPEKSNIEDDDRSWQRGPDGCDNWVFEKSTVANPPVADANGPYSGDVDTLLRFNGSRSGDPDGEIVLYEWDFGDGSTGVGKNPTHSYASVGTYEITLTVTDNVGASDIDITSANIVAKPAFPFSPYIFLTGGITLLILVIAFMLIRRKES